MTGEPPADPPEEGVGDDDPATGPPDGDDDPGTGIPAWAPSADPSVPVPRALREAVIRQTTQEQAYVTQHFTISQDPESLVIISMRDYERLTERVDSLQDGGWADLWLAGVGVGVALAMGALVGALTLTG